MMPGARSCGEATCTVAIPASLPRAVRAGVREVAAVYVPAEHRRKGLARALMRQLCDEADAARVVLLLAARPFGDADASVDDLVALYASVGFVRIQGTPLLMARTPVIGGWVRPTAVARAAAQLLH